MCAVSFHAAALCPESASVVIGMPAFAHQGAQDATFFHAAVVLAKFHAEFAVLPAAAASTDHACQIMTDSA